MIRDARLSISIAHYKALVCTIDVIRPRKLFSATMILGYGDKKTQAFAAGTSVKAFQSFEMQAEKRLAILNAAPDLATLQALPSNRLEALGGGGVGQYAIRINKQWRICFKWPAGQSGPSEVEIVDYHR